MMELLTYLTFENPVFQVYVVCASIMTLKLVLQGWITVGKMFLSQGGFRTPEDTNPSPLFFFVDESFLSTEQSVERSRRVHQNDLENIPAFLVAGFLFIFTEPSFLLASILMYGYVIVRLLHTVIYEMALVHDLRAICYLTGSLITAYMAAHSFYYAVFLSG